MMKRLFFSLMMLCAMMMAQAQTIRVNQKFWDGYSLYTVKEIRMGKIIYMTTKQGDELTLEKVPGKQMIVPLALSMAGGYNISIKRAITFLLSASPTVTPCGQWH